MKLFLSILLFISVKGLFSQSFQKEYRFTTNDFGLMTNVKPIHDSNFVFVINSAIELANNDKRAIAQVAIVDKFGNVLKSKTFQSRNANSTTSSGLGTSLIVTPDSKIIFTREEFSLQGGYSIVCLDSNLNLLWSKIMPEQRNFTNSSLAYINGHTFVVSTYGTDTILPNNIPASLRRKISIYKIDNAGNVIDSKSLYSENSLGLSAHIEKNLNNQLVLTMGDIRKAPTYLYPVEREYKGCVVILDTSLNIQDQQCFENFSIQSTTQLSNGNYIVKGIGCVDIDCTNSERSIICLIDNMLMPKWSLYFDSNEMNTTNKVVEASNGDFYFGKFITNALESKWIFSRITQLGDIVNEYATNQLSIYSNCGRSALGKYYWSSLGNNFSFVLTVTDSIENNMVCPLMPLCEKQLTPFNLSITNENFYLEPYSQIANFPLDTINNPLQVNNYCNDVGTLNADFNLPEDTFCIGELLSLYSLPTLKLGNSEWIISGAVDTQFYELNVEGFALEANGTYSILHIHTIGACVDSVGKNIFVKGIRQSGQTIAYCDTVFRSDISLDCNFTWFNGDTTSFIIPQSNQFDVTYQCDGCEGNATIQLQQLNKPELLRSNVTWCEGEDNFLNLNSTGIDVAIWSDGIIATSRTFDTSGIYYVELFNAACYSQDTLQVNFIVCSVPIDTVETIDTTTSNCNFYIPNAFSPNGDGINDEFKIAGNCKQIDNIYFRIFNRWGEKVFETTNINTGWDGYYKGKLQLPNVYVYDIGIVYSLTNNKEMKKYSGSFVLLQ